MTDAEDAQALLRLACHYRERGLVAEELRTFVQALIASARVHRMVPTSGELVYLDLKADGESLGTLMIVCDHFVVELPLRASEKLGGALGPLSLQHCSESAHR